MRPITPPIQPLDNAVVAATVINAIETNDIAALEALMCKNIKQNVSDLPMALGIGTNELKLWAVAL